MSNVKFSKGDLVKILADPDGIATGVVLGVTSVKKVSGQEDAVTLWATYINEHNEEESCTNEYWADELELIPHADTKRLEWLIVNLSNMDIEDIRYFLKACLNAEKLEEVDFEKLLKETKETMGE